MNQLNSKKERLLFVAKVGGIVLLLGIFYAILIEHFPFLAVPCMVYKRWGIYCGSCGISRMALSLLHGDLFSAFCYNPYLFITWPVVAGLFILFVFRYVIEGKWIFRSFEKRVGYIWLGFFLCFMLARNLPWFSYLAPGGLL